MAIIGIAASDAGIRLAGSPAGAVEDVRAAIGESVARLAPGAPLVVLIHGYKFNPERVDRDPHALLFASRPRRTCGRIRSWPTGLGLAGVKDGLCIGFGWPATAGHLPHLLNTGRTGFAHVYDRAGRMGGHLATLIGMVQAAAPGRPVDVVAHSLGARVALSALPHLAVPPGRLILLGAAEFDGMAERYLAGRRGEACPEIYNVTARANDLFDLAFETFAPRPSACARALGNGLPTPPPFWVDLQIDRRDVAGWIIDRGIALSGPASRLCHWSFYTRVGAFDLYRAILGRQPGWDVADLRAVPCLRGQDPRWSRVVPALGRLWATPDMAPDLGLGRDLTRA